MDNQFRIMLVVAGMLVIAAAGIVIALRVSHLPAQPPLPVNTSSSPVTPAAPASANWRHLGSDAGVPFNDLVTAIAFDADGNLYVGGAFTDVAGVPEADYLAVWSPVTQQWSALGGANGFGALNALVSTIVVTGDLVYVGGSFTDAAGIAEADGVAVWNTTTRRWAALGDNGQGDGALANAVSRLAVAGDMLYAGGLFQDAASIAAADFIAAWDGRRWSALGSNGQGDGALNHLVAAIVVAGDKVYVGGLFTDVAGIAHADYLAVWDGAQWAALSDRSDVTPLTSEVYSLVFDHRGNLYVSGAFTDLAGIAAADYVAVWDGAAWAALGSNGHGDGALRNIVVALAVDQSNQIYVGGNVSNVAAIDAADYVALWDGARWQALPHVAGGVLTAPVRTITLADDKVYVASGGINFAEPGAAPFAAMWDSTRQAWSDLDPQGAFQHGLQINVLRHDGTRLYAGGWFTDAAGPAADYIAVWDGAQWAALGDNGRGDGALTNMVTALFITEDGNLYVAGFFQDAAGIPEADNVAVWNGADWQALGSSDSAVRGTVWAMTVIDGALYIGGSFTSASDPTISFIAMWDGSRWAPLDDGRGSTLNGEVTAMVVSGDKLYVGGAFTDVAGIAEADYVAVWNVTTRQWSALGSNGRGDGAMADRVNALAVDSKGNLYVGGFFTDVAGMPAADNIAVWNGAQWSALGDNGRGESALNGEVFALAVMGSDLYIGGNFTNAGQNPRADYIVVYSLAE